jgi:Domain of unknown function (DUF4783)
MKNLLFILFIGSTLAMTVANLSAISKALSNGNADVLAQYFDETVEIAIMDEEDQYDKAQAKQIVKNFFAKHKVSSYTQVHQGVSKGKDSQYTIGNLKANGDTFRVYVYMKVTNGKYIIQELRFDKE